MTLKERVLDKSARAGAILATVAMLTIAGCATPPTDPAARAEFDRTNDPLEPLNREIFDFNLFVDRIAIKPLAQGYEAVVPEKGRDAIRHFLNNLNEPIVFANDLLQGEFKRAHTTFARFLMNSTFGLGGIMDLATGEGLEKQTGDFGQTLYSWGVPDGPYIVIPIIGPSNPRDGIGLGVDGYADPWGQILGRNNLDYVTYARYAVDGIDLRQRNLQTFDDLQRNAIDFYAELRSLFRQHRAQELRHGEPAPIPDLDSLYRDPAAVPQVSQAVHRN
ncbi:MAG TPA: VacJ family lipoprotein [Stellaceae bacterium]|nr:VacJ family lipoprotein [Stellaceae bacterium]